MNFISSSLVRHATAVSFFLTVGCILYAGVKTIPVTPQTLSGWTLTGANRGEVGTDAQLDLPAGSQLTRSFAAEDIIVRLTTQPVLGLDPDDWPVLELGSAALILTRQGNVGKLAVVIGDNEPVVFAASIPLDNNGKSTAPVELSLSRHAGAFVINAFGQELIVPTDSAPTVDVVASAGVTENWVVGQLSVVITTPDAATTDEPSRGTGHARVAADGFNQTSKGTISSGPASADKGMPKPDAVKTGTAQTAAVAVGLEIFTPPSFRTGRAESLRATVAQTHVK